MATAALMLFVACGTAIAPAASQQPESGGGGRRGAKPERGSPITLAVDSVEKRTWTPAQLRGLATTQWTNERGMEHPAIPLGVLVQESGVPMTRVRELRIKSNARTVTLKGDDLAGVESLVLRTGRNSNRPWRLVPIDPAEKDRFNLTNVRRIEVVTTE